MHAQISTLFKVQRAFSLNRLFLRYRHPELLLSATQEQIYLTLSVYLHLASLLAVIHTIEHSSILEQVGLRTLLQRALPLTLDLTLGFILVLMEGSIHIGEAGRLAGVSVDTIRFYQRQGLIPATPRSAGGYRLFGEEQIRDLAFVKHAQELGFSLNEIKELLSLRQSQHVCPGVQSVLERKLQEVRDKMQRLVHMERELSRELRNCKRKLRMKPSVRHEECCPLIEKLEQEDGRRAKRSNATRK